MYWIDEDFMDRLNKLVLHKRFRNIKELQNCIDKQENWIDDADIFAHHKFILEDISDKYEDLPDFNIIGEFNGEYVYCNLDIYYLVDRQGYYYITEIGFDFE